MRTPLIEGLEVLRLPESARHASFQSTLPTNNKRAPFAEEELVLLTSPEVTSDDPLEILQDMPYIRRAAVGVLVDQWLQKNNITVKEAMVMESIEMVEHNLGVSIVPNLCMPDSTFKRLRKISLQPVSLPRVLGILTRSDCSKIRMVERLGEQIEAVCQDTQVGLES